MGEYREPADSGRKAREEATVAGAVAGLMEHFETVQVFVTRAGGGAERGTISCVDGAGNWFARYGQVREWIEKEDHASRLCVERDFDADADSDD